VDVAWLPEPGHSALLGIRHDAVDFDVVLAIDQYRPYEESRVYGTVDGCSSYIVVVVVVVASSWWWWRGTS